MANVSHIKNEDKLNSTLKVGSAKLVNQAERRDFLK